jgi:hypothetical protein
MKKIRRKPRKKKPAPDVYQLKVMMNQHLIVFLFDDGE